MAHFEYDMDNNDISFIRFGKNGAAGSESWTPGQKMKPYMINKLEELLRVAKGEKPNEKKVENLEDMLD